MNKKLKAYFLYTFVSAWILQGVAAYCLHQGQRTLYTLILAFSMFMPMVGGLLSGHSLKSVGWKFSLKKNGKMLLWAWFGPAVLGLLGASLFYLCFPRSFDTTGSFLTLQVGPDALSQIAEQGLTLPLFMVLQIASSLLYAPIVNALFAVGEEFGWRGCMNPMLKEHYGSTKGLLVGGLIWGVWHWPIMALAGYEYGTAYWGFPIVGMVLFCLITTAMGVLLDVIYEKSGSIVFPAIAHGAINGFAGIPMLFLSVDYVNYQLLGPALVGILGGLPMILSAGWILFKKKSGE